MQSTNPVHPELMPIQWTLLLSFKDEDTKLAIDGNKTEGVFVTLIMCVTFLKLFFFFKVFADLIAYFRSIITSANKSF